MRQHRSKRVLEGSSILAPNLQGRLRYLQTAYAGHVTFAELPHHIRRDMALLHVRPDAEQSLQYQCSVLSQKVHSFAHSFEQAELAGTSGYLQINPDDRTQVETIVKLIGVLSQSGWQFPDAHLTAWGALAVSFDQQSGWNHSLALDQLLSRWDLPQRVRQSFLDQLTVIQTMMTQGQLKISHDGCLLQYSVIGKKTGGLSLKDLAVQWPHNTWPILMLAETEDRSLWQVSGCLPIRWLHHAHSALGLQGIAILRELTTAQDLPIQKAS